MKRQGEQSLWVKPDADGLPGVYLDFAWTWFGRVFEFSSTSDVEWTKVAPGTVEVKRLGVSLVADSATMWQHLDVPETVEQFQTLVVEAGRIRFTIGVKEAAAPLHPLVVSLMERNRNVVVKA